MLLNEPTRTGVLKQMNFEEPGFFGIVECNDGKPEVRALQSQVILNVRAPFEGSKVHFQAAQSADGYFYTGWLREPRSKTG